MPEKANKMPVEEAMRPIGIPSSVPKSGKNKLSGRMGNPVIKPTKVNNPYSVTMLAETVITMTRNLSRDGRNIKSKEMLSTRKFSAVLGAIGIFFTPKLANNMVLLSHPKSPMTGIIIVPTIRVIAISRGVTAFVFVLLIEFIYTSFNFFLSILFTAL